jgi:putative endonuclease
MEEVIGSTPIFSTKGSCFMQDSLFMPYSVYILYSRIADKYYVGESEDVNARLQSHLSGISKFTSIADDWKLVYIEQYETRTEAVRRERNIKRKKSRKYIEWLINGD